MYHNSLLRRRNRYFNSRLCLRLSYNDLFSNACFRVSADKSINADNLLSNISRIRSVNNCDCFPASFNRNNISTRQSKRFHQLRINARNSLIGIILQGFNNLQPNFLLLDAHAASWPNRTLNVPKSSKQSLTISSICFFMCRCCSLTKLTISFGMLIAWLFPTIRSLTTNVLPRSSLNLSKEFKSAGWTTLS